eukprot:g5372.t1
MMVVEVALVLSLLIPLTISSNADSSALIEGTSNCGTGQRTFFLNEESIYVSPVVPGKDVTIRAKGVYRGDAIIHGPLRIREDGTRSFKSRVKFQALAFGIPVTTDLFHLITENLEKASDDKWWIGVDSPLKKDDEFNIRISYKIPDLAKYLIGFTITTRAHFHDDEGNEIACYQLALKIGKDASPVGSSFSLTGLATLMKNNAPAMAVADALSAASNMIAPSTCKIREHVVDKECVECPRGFGRIAGDLRHGKDTSCHKLSFCDNPKPNEFAQSTEDGGSVCKKCTSVPHTATDAEITCTTEFDTRISACKVGYFLETGQDSHNSEYEHGTPDQCWPCTPPEQAIELCNPGEYIPQCLGIEVMENTCVFCPLISNARIVSCQEDWGSEGISLSTVPIVRSHVVECFEGFSVSNDQLRCIPHRKGPNGNIKNGKNSNLNSTELEVSTSRKNHTKNSSEGNVSAGNSDSKKKNIDIVLSESMNVDDFIAEQTETFEEIKVILEKKDPYSDSIRKLKKLSENQKVLVDRIELLEETLRQQQAEPKSNKVKETVKNPIFATILIGICLMFAVQMVLK